MHQISIEGTVISYTLERIARTRSLRLTIHPNSTITVKVPTRASDEFIAQFLRSKSSWILKHLRKLAENPKVVLSQDTALDFEKYKNKARVLALNRLEHFNAFYGLRWTRITIRNQKTRWGSCSKKGALSFSYKIALLPEKHRDYIIVHELCHLGEFNHSSKFWSLVAKAIPDYKLIRKEIKQIV